MNYLAHLYLSGDNEHVVVGNFIGDYVKGKDYLKYPEMIKFGILLHRQIDSFTDSHIKCIEAKELFRKDFRLYSGIVVDFIYDHILAKNWNCYSEINLNAFAGHIHKVLMSHIAYLPTRVQSFLPFLIQHRRLESYATERGIIHSMNIMTRYTSFPSKSDIAIRIYRENKEQLTENFNLFMKELIEFITEKHGVDFQKNYPLT